VYGQIPLFLKATKHTTVNIRPRRNRKNVAIRDAVQESRVTVNHLIYPLFVVDGKNKKEPISSLPGCFRWSEDLLLNEIAECMELGIRMFVLFPAFKEADKDATASISSDPSNFYLRIIASVKNHFPEAVVMTDVAMDPYSSDGHDGLVKDGKILNDESLPILANMAVAQARAGADIIGPSDMMDGRIGYIREALDNAGFTEVSIMSYTAKYASAFYGPFREALDSAPKAGDKKTYQMNPFNKKEALLEADLDIEEGADFLMVKPALAYLDIIHILKENYTVPIAAYNVSGEYAMIKAAAEKGWLNYNEVMNESLGAIKRAGADIILTYFAKDFAKLDNAK